MVSSTFHPAPVWLTKSYMEVVLRNYMKDNDLVIIGLEIKPATAKGENYASVMTRIKADFRLTNSKDTQQGSYIVKTTYENDAYVASIMNPYDIYNTEMIMYEKVLPKLAKLLSEIGDTDKLFADTIFVDYEHSAIIFEDLAVLNFTLADRVMGLDMPNAKLALKKLAKMHATAAVLNERQPGVLQKFDHGIFNKYTRGFAPFFENVFEVCANFAGDCPKLGQYYKEKLQKLKSCVMEYGTRAYVSDEVGHFHTLNHGDYWTNNVMFRYEAAAANNNLKKTTDMMIIDFQFSFWGSPAVDLHYFLNTSLQSSLRLHQQDELVQYYHAVLVETLRALNYVGHVPTLHEFCLQVEAGRFVAVISAIVSQPIMINDQNDDADFNSLMLEDDRGNNFRKMLYTNEKVQEHVKALLPIFDRRGLLDVAA